MAAQESALKFTPWLAQMLGFSEASLRVLFTPFFGLPLAYIQRTYLYNTSVKFKHIYVLICGLCLAYFNYGYDIIHSLITVLLNYILFHTVGGTQLCVGISVVLNMTYLMSAYYVTQAADGYDISWTSPQCIMTLKMIGTAFDLLDGKKPVATLSKDQKELYVSKPPSFLELSAFIFFYGGFFAGPQFPLRRYVELAEGKLSDNTDNRPVESIPAAMNSFKWGMFYCLVVAFITPIYPSSFLFTTDFTESAFVYKLYIIAVWGHVTFAKYCCIFSLFDSVCILAGLGYNGRDEKGNALWDGCIGARAWGYEVSLTMKEVIASMNVSTNKWAALYIYKRLKFLGNRYISQFCTIAFLAVWHGWYLGYYITFAFEMAVINFEMQFGYIAYKTPWLSKLPDNKNWKIPIYIVRKLWQLEYLAYPLVSFTFLKWKRIKVVHGAVYYYPYFLFFGWPFIYFLLILPLLNRKDKEKKRKELTKTEQNTNGATSDSHNKTE